MAYAGIVECGVRLGSGSLDEPDALWTVKYQRSTYRNHRALMAPAIIPVIYPVAPADYQARMDVEMTDLTMTDNIGMRNALNGGIWVLVYPNQGVMPVTGSRFEHNGVFSDDPAAASVKSGFMVSGPPGGAFSSTFRFANSEWVDNAA